MELVKRTNKVRKNWTKVDSPDKWMVLDCMKVLSQYVILIVWLMHPPQAETMEECACLGIGFMKTKNHKVHNVAM
jgi:hypothetical protein